jgi:hypothetical protein
MKPRWILSVILSLKASVEPSGGTWLFDDFESDNHVSANGLAWIPLGDDLLGGNSKIALETVPRGANGRGHALRLDGTVGSGPSAFTGAWAALDGEGRPADLGAFDALRFTAKGRGSFQVGLRSGAASTMANFMASFTPGSEWKEYEIPFEQLAPARPGSPSARFSVKEVHWIGFTTAPGAAGPFQLEIDDVALLSHGSEKVAPVVAQGKARVTRVTLTSAPKLGAWRELGRDPAGDGKQRSLPDVTVLSVMTDDSAARVWFRIGVQEELPQSWVGVNLALDTDSDTANGMAWWGVNTAFHFDRLVSVWLFKTGLAYQGMAGTADAADVAKGEFMTNTDVSVAIDREARTFLVGVPRAVLGGAAPTRVVAAVGSAMTHNDDLPDAGALVFADPGASPEH